MQCGLIEHQKNRINQVLTIGIWTNGKKRVTNNGNNSVQDAPGLTSTVFSYLNAACPVISAPVIKR